MAFDSKIKESWHICMECNWRFRIKIVSKRSVHVYETVADDADHLIQSRYHPLPLGTPAINAKDGLQTWKCLHCECLLVIAHYSDSNDTPRVITDNKEMLKLLQELGFFSSMDEIDWRPSETIPEDYYAF